MPRPSFIAYLTPWSAAEVPKPPLTTLAVGEESGAPRPSPKPVTSMMVGEESGTPR
jgi:hypothetical protein